MINRPEFLLARDPGGSALVQLGVSQLQQDESLAAFLQRITRNADLEVGQKSWGATVSISVTPPGSNDKQPARLSAISLEGGLVLTLLGTASASQFTAADEKFTRVNSSFERLGQAAIDAIEIPRLRILPRGGETFQTLARSSALETDAESRLRLLNRAFPKGDINKLDRIKTVVYEN